jgi:hypothetical protein
MSGSNIGPPPSPELDVVEHQMDAETGEHDDDEREGSPDVLARRLTRTVEIDVPMSRCERAPGMGNMDLPQAGKCSGHHKRTSVQPVREGRRSKLDAR